MIQRHLHAHHGEEDWQKGTMHTLTRISSILSIVSCLAIIISYRFKKFRTHMNILICYMSIAEILATFFFSLGETPAIHPDFCRVQGFGLQIFNLSKLLWASAMATHCFFAVRHQLPLGELTSYVKFYHCIAWGLPISIAGIVYSMEFILRRGPVYTKNHL